MHRATHGGGLDRDRPRLSAHGTLPRRPRLPARATTSSSSTTRGSPATARSATAPRSAASTGMVPFTRDRHVRVRRRHAPRSTADVPPYMLVDGQPATVRGVNVIGLRRAGIGRRRAPRAAGRVSPALPQRAGPRRAPSSASGDEVPADAAGDGAARVHRDRDASRDLRRAAHGRARIRRRDRGGECLMAAGAAACARGWWAPATWGSTTCWSTPSWPTSSWSASSTSTTTARSRRRRRSTTRGPSRDHRELDRPGRRGQRGGADRAALPRGARPAGGRHQRARGEADDAHARGGARALRGRAPRRAPCCTSATSSASTARCTSCKQDRATARSSIESRRLGPVRAARAEGHGGDGPHDPRHRHRARASWTRRRVRLAALGCRRALARSPTWPPCRSASRRATIATITASRATEEKIRTLAITQPDAYIVLDYTDQDIHIHRRAAQEYTMNRELDPLPPGLVRRAPLACTATTPSSWRSSTCSARTRRRRAGEARAAGRADDLRSLAMALEIERMIRDGVAEVTWREAVP